MSVTKAVLLAAGRGTRLGAITANYPKALVEVGGRPIISHILHGLADAGVRNAFIVTGHYAELVEADLGDRTDDGIRLRYRRQQTLDGTARALTLARGFCGDDSFFFGWGDILVDAENYSRVAAVARRAESVLAVNRVSDPTAGGAVYVIRPASLESGRSSRITGLVEKPSAGTSTTPWNNAGFGVLGPSIWNAIGGLRPSERGEYELPQAIAALVDAGVHVRAVPVVGPWFDVGTPEELERARKSFLAR